MDLVFNRLAEHLNHVSFNTNQVSPKVLRNTVTI